MSRQRKTNQAHTQIHIEGAANDKFRRLADEEGKTLRGLFYSMMEVYIRTRYQPVPAPASTPVPASAELAQNPSAVDLCTAVQAAYIVLVNEKTNSFPIVNDVADAAIDELFAAAKKNGDDGVAYSIFVYWLQCCIDRGVTDPVQMVGLLPELSLNLTTNKTDPVEMIGRLERMYEAPTGSP